MLIIEGHVPALTEPVSRFHPEVQGELGFAVEKDGDVELIAGERERVPPTIPRTPADAHLPAWPARRGSQKEGGRRLLRPAGRGADR